MARTERCARCNESQSFDALGICPACGWKQESWLGQIKTGGAWMDYSRGVEFDARVWQGKDPANRRVVDWISGEVLVEAS